MNTQQRVRRLETGQVLPAPARGEGPAVLTEGELLLQQPARWLGGTLVMTPPARLVAPALVPDMEPGSIVAVRASTVIVQQREPAFTGRAAAAWMRRILGRRSLAA